MFPVYVFALFARGIPVPRSRFWTAILTGLCAFGCFGGLLLLTQSHSVKATVPDLQDRLQLSESLNRLLLQQIDATFELAMEDYLATGQITEMQIVFFKSWQRYDQEYVDRVKHHPSSLFDRATALSRRGRVFLMLDKPQRAVEQFHVATELLSELVKTSPTIPCYTADLIAARTMAATCFRHLQSPAEAQAELLRAEQVIYDSQLPTQDDTDRLLSFLADQIQRQRGELDVTSKQGGSNLSRPGN